MRCAARVAPEKPDIHPACRANQVDRLETEMITHFCGKEDFTGTFDVSDWHIMGNDCVLPVLTSLISILRIHCESVGKVPPDKPFSVLQAVTQSVQPLLHLPLSINIPQRTLLSAPLLM